jgi:hypothetical protein
MYVRTASSMLGTAILHGNTYYSTTYVTKLSIKPGSASTANRDSPRLDYGHLASNLVLVLGRLYFLSSLLVHNSLILLSYPLVPYSSLSDPNLTLTFLSI